MKKSLHIFIALVLTLSLSVLYTNAQTTRTINSNLLNEYGISPKVLDAALSTTLQSGSFKQDVKINKTVDGNSESYKFQMVYDPAFKEGIDIQMWFWNDSLGNIKQKELLRTMQEMHSFSRLSMTSLYDENSLAIISSEEGSLILGFRYDAKRLEPELKYGAKVKGKIFITNGVLEKVVLTNDVPLKYKSHRIEANNAISTVYYTRLENYGGYIVQEVQSEYSYREKKRLVEVTIDSKTIDYSDPSGIELEWAGKPASPAIDTGYNYLTGSLGWALPLFGKSARKLGYSLPRPVGINIFSHQQFQQLQFTDLMVGANGAELLSLADLFELEGSKVDQITKITMIKADVWLLPFLNIMGVFGQGKNSIDGSLYLDPEFRDALIKLGWLVGLDPDDIPEYLPIKSELTALTYGGGITLAGGIENVNISLSYQLVASSIPEVNTTKLAHVIAPSLGYMTNFGMNIMVGAQGQFYNTMTTGFINLPQDNRLDYNVNFEPIRWNYIVGLYVPISNHFELAVQSGWGKRRSLTVVFGYRF